MSTRIITTGSLADRLLTSRSVPSWLADFLLVLAGSALVAASARVSIPLPFTPVPITGQTFGVLLVGAAMGSRRGALALALYLLEGGAGLPVFAGGAAGRTHLLGPTAGYLFSYPIAAGVVGWLAERGLDRRPHGALAAMLLSETIILAAGTLWLSAFVGGLSRAFIQGALPFLPGDLVKALLASALLPCAWKLIGIDHRAS